MTRLCRVYRSFSKPHPDEAEHGREDIGGDRRADGRGQPRGEGEMREEEDEDEARRR
jgi:hypothetical protein